MRTKSAIVLLLLTIILAAAPVGAQDARGANAAGAAAQANENYHLAIDKYRQALSINPAHLESMVGLAESFFLLEEYDEAGRWVGEARKFDKNNIDIITLEGRILIGKEDLAGARSLFQGVLDKQPNNLEARFGLAEIEVAQGRSKNALSQYAQTLKLAPESKKALLSLAMVSEAAGDMASAGTYFDLALRSHSTDAQVHMEAGAYFARIRSFAAAERHAKTAIALKPSLESARVLLGGIYMETGRYADAAAAFRDVVAANRDSSLAWYGLGLSYRASGDPAKAVSSFTTGLGVSPDDEVARISLESTALAQLPMNDAARKKAAMDHLAEGLRLSARNYLDKALIELRRSLILDPTSTEGRVAYARIYRSTGFRAKYLSELSVLASLGVKDPFVKDEIEALTSELADSVSSNWKYDQYNLERPRYLLDMFTIPEGNRLLHVTASEDLAGYAASQLEGYDAVDLGEGSRVTRSFEEAFRAGRQKDYFIILRFEESERTFTAYADVYLGRTGSKVAGFSAFRTGNDRVRDSIAKLCGEIAAMLPLRGTLLARSFDVGLVDLGTFHGVQTGDRLVIVRKGKLRLEPDGTGLAYDPGDLLGELTATASDEAVTEGTIQRSGYFDFINLGDEVLRAKAPSSAPTTAARSATPAQAIGSILSRLFGIGGKPQAAAP